MKALHVLAVALIFPSTASAQLQLMAPEELRSIRASLPRLAGDNELDAVLRDPSSLWYTDKEVPAAYQLAVGNGYVPTTFHSAHWNLSGDPSDFNLPGRNGLARDAGGNANGEFPWNVAPGGAHESPSVLAFKAIRLPVVEGRILPIVYFEDNLLGRRGGDRVVSSGGLAEGPSSEFNRVLRWIYPVGTVFVEVLTMRDPDGFDRVFEVRFRIRESDAWGVEIFRPVANVEALAKAIESLPPSSDSATNKLRAKAIVELRSPKALPTSRLVDLRHNRERAFDAESGVDQIPTLATDDVVAILDRPFVSALGEVWRMGTNGIEAIAPSNDSELFGLVPPHYRGTFVGNDRNGCLKCHESTNREATEFEHPRGWYGRVRGSDGIFSFHPIEPSSVASRGLRIPIRIRSSFVESGLVAPYDARIHSRDRYLQIKGLQ